MGDRTRAQGRITTEADRQVARFNLLTPGQIAARLADETIDSERVRSWMEEPDPARRLRAVDCRRRGAPRPAWMAEWSWVVAFVEARSNNAAA